MSRSALHAGTCLLTGLLIAASTGAAQDLCTGLVQDKLARPMTALAKPGLYQTVVDPEFGTTIRRITAVTPSGSNPVIKPHYATISAWNADESYLLLFEVQGGRHRLHNGRTYEFIKYVDLTPPDIEQVFWHTTDPDIIFYVSYKTLIRYHVSTGQKESLRTFSFCTEGASGGGDPMFGLSWDSARIGLGCGNQIFVYDIPTDTILGQKTLDTYAPQMAPSGTLAYLGGVPYVPGGGKVMDVQLNVLRSLDLKEPWGHSALGRYANGHDTWNGVVYDPGPAGNDDIGMLVTWDLTNATSKVVIGPKTGWPYPPAGHISTLALQQPGWVFVSTFGKTSGAGLLDMEMLAADTNTGKVCRIGRHRSWGKANTKLAEPYWAEAHTVPSPSGTRAVFASDWGNGASVDSYVVELRSPNPSLRLIHPNGGESWPAGSTQTIQWLPANLSPDATVHVSLSNGVTTTQLITVPRTQSSYNWKVLDTQGSSWTVSVCSEAFGECEVSDASDAPFSIVPTVTVPAVRHDLSADGQADILWHNQNTGALYAWEMGGSTVTSGRSLSPSSFMDPRWQIRALADFNADGRNDLLWHHMGTGELYVWFMNGTSAVGGSYLTPSRFSDTRWQIRAAADFDRNGTTDLLWHHQVTGDLYVWFMDGLSASTGSYMTPSRFADTRWQIRAAADFDRNGTTDLLWHHQLNGDLYFWFMAGVVTTSGSYATPSRLADPRWTIVQVADFDGDDSVDLLWRHQLTGDLYVWYMAGTRLTRGGYLSPSRLSDGAWVAAPK